MSTTIETPTAEPKQLRKQRRKPLNAPTFIKRLTVEEGSVLRVTITDTSDDGVGFTSIIPLRVGDRLAVGLTVAGTPAQMLLTRINHCAKNPAGQYRLGATVVERQPGDIVKIRVPANWLVTQN